MARRRHRPRPLDGRHQAPAHGHAQRIDRRIVDGDDQDGAVARQMDGGVSPAAVDGLDMQQSPVLVSSHSETQVRKWLLIGNDTAFAPDV
jgi:hypothetical protein